MIIWFKRNFLEMFFLVVATALLVFTLLNVDDLPDAIYQPIFILIPALYLLAALKQFDEIAFPGGMSAKTRRKIEELEKIEKQIKAIATEFSEPVINLALFTENSSRARKRLKDNIIELLHLSDAPKEKIESVNQLYIATNLNSLAEIAQSSLHLKVLKMMNNNKDDERVRPLWEITCSNMLSAEVMIEKFLKKLSVMPDITAEERADLLSNKALLEYQSFQQHKEFVGDRDLNLIPETAF